MRRLIPILIGGSLAVALCGGCTRGMVRASEIKPAVDLVVADYVRLVPEGDTHRAQKIALANELKRTVDLAAEGGGD